VRRPSAAHDPHLDRVLAAIILLAGLAGGALRDTMTVPGRSSEGAAQRLAEGFPEQVGAHAHVVAHTTNGVIDEIPQKFEISEGFRGGNSAVVPCE